MKPLVLEPGAASALSPWWERPDLRFVDGKLHFAGRCVDTLTSWSVRPVFLYSADRVLANAAMVQAALDDAGLAGDVLFAIKANRFAPLLTVLAGSRRYGADVCSPNEVKAALAVGFAPAQISFTASSLSDEDLSFLAKFPDITINLDSLSALRRLGARAPGRTIGLRINPKIAVGGNDKLTYAGTKPTKFGLYPEQWGEALAIAAQFGLRIETLHLHAGCGVLTDQLTQWRQAMEAALALRQALPDLRFFNVGGGLGVQHSATWGSLDLGRWSAALRDIFAGSGLRVQVEPGDYIAKDAGLLVLTVNGVETKGGTCFVGVNGGFNLAPEPAFYDLPCEPVPCRLRSGPAQAVTVAGNINEALDLWYSDILMPPLAEGDRLAFLNAGAYAASMSSNHCLRGEFEEMLLA